jgi:hypothetical protein
LSVAEHSAELTSDRSERKYVLAQDAAPSLLRQLGQKLAPHRYTGAGANVLPRARHYTTTVYFDTARRDLYRLALAGGRHVKVRAREYYDLHPDLTELATDASELVRYRPVLWVELKTRDGERSQKHRIALPKPEVRAFFEQLAAGESVRAVQDAASASELETVLEELRSLRREVGAPLLVSCLVHYRRHAFEDGREQLRITLDRELAAFAPPADLLTAPHALIRERFGHSAYEESLCVLEVKSRGAPPPWLDALLSAHGASASSYSKFEMASRAVAGPLP